MTVGWPQYPLGGQPTVKPPPANAEAGVQSPPKVALRLRLVRTARTPMGVEWELSIVINRADTLATASNR